MPSFSEIKEPFWFSRSLGRSLKMERGVVGRFRLGTAGVNSFSRYFFLSSIFPSFDSFSLIPSFFLSFLYIFSFVFFFFLFLYLFSFIKTQHVQEERGGRLDDFKNKSCVDFIVKFQNKLIRAVLKIEKWV